MGFAWLIAPCDVVSSASATPKTILSETSDTPHVARRTSHASRMRIRLKEFLLEREQPRRRSSPELRIHSDKNNGSHQQSARQHSAEASWWSLFLLQRLKRRLRPTKGAAILPRAALTMIPKEFLCPRLRATLESSPLREGRPPTSSPRSSDRRNDFPHSVGDIPTRNGPSHHRRPGLMSPACWGTPFTNPNRYGELVWLFRDLPRRRRGTSATRRLRCRQPRRSLSQLPRLKL